MSGLEEQRDVLAAKFGAILPHLDERQRRLLIGAEAQSLGHGGIRAVARAAGVREARVSAGIRELASGEAPLGRIRRPGGGRKRVVDLNPAVRKALLTLVEPDVRGDPMSPLRWTTKSPRKLAEELARQGHRICADTVGDLLREEGFSLQSNAKTLEGKQHPDRDAQFHYLNAQARNHQDSGAPVISVDTKEKELVGPFKNNGREWEPRGEPVRVDTHDFPDRELGKAVPYGIYDVAANAGWVNVGTDHDTAAFAVESIRRWWNSAGRAIYPTAGRLLITADAGGSNGYRTRTWKTELAQFAAESGLTISVCHLPPGTQCRCLTTELSSPGARRTSLFSCSAGFAANENEQMQFMEGHMADGGADPLADLALQLRTLRLRRRLQMGGLKFPPRLLCRVKLLERVLRRLQVDSGERVQGS
jgi:transposase